MLTIRSINDSDRNQLVELLSSIQNFTADEVDVALELIDISLQKKEGDYLCLIAEKENRVAGYLCYGPTPMTHGTYDLYWIATHSYFTRQGIARKLFDYLIQLLEAKNFRLLRVETSSQESYLGTHDFYLRIGLKEEARVRDFYKDNDDLVIYTWKNLKRN
jgi:ribosomal protein S18 acetylase RimI-like enzyme